MEEHLLRLIDDHLRHDPAASDDPAALYRTALSDLVDNLLSDERPQSMSPEAVGEAYERLRGFRLEITAEGRPLLVPTAASKRNQGLFYTPPDIVRHIVASTLDALEITTPSEYLALKIVDPAVGTGTFLAEALEQLAARALLDLPRRPGPEPAGPLGKQDYGPVRSSSDEERNIRLHILENCLYGLDLDRTAVRIAHAVLGKRVADARLDGAVLHGHVRVGNALMGATRGEAALFVREQWNLTHAEAYFGKGLPDRLVIEDWCRTKGIIHWPIEFPEAASSDGSGFHAVIGNPPYEIVSVKESGIEERRREQRYFRRMYRTCSGKINTYRLMLERGLDLLVDGGALGFIVPATLLADSTAASLRKMLLDGFSVRQCVVIPEKARVFEGVTQAFAIIVVRKDGKKTSLFPVVWDGAGQIPTRGPVEISRSLIDSAGLRIPILKSEEEKALLERLSKHPTFKGDERWPPAGEVHQGEINLTVHRRFITTQETSLPLIRGEHVQPFWVQHPAPGKARLDWVRAEFLEETGGSRRDKSQRQPCEKDFCGQGIRSDAWRKERIVVGRVVNMDTTRRLKAAPVPTGCFLGDMTNSISDVTVPGAYLLGLLNSRLLNWRFKLTSTNNYISAAEIECLPVPRATGKSVPLFGLPATEKKLEAFLFGPHDSVQVCVDDCSALFAAECRAFGTSFLAAAIERLVEAMVSGSPKTVPPSNDLFVVLDSLVMLLYEVEWAAGIRELWET